MTSYQSNIRFSYDIDEQKSDPDLVYYSANIINNGSQDDAKLPDEPDPEVVFQEQRDSPIIQDCSKYNFSIIRFSLNGTGRNLPIFIPQIRLGANNLGQNVNLTVYDVSLSVTYNIPAGPFSGTLNATQAVIYEPEITDPAVAPVPPASSTLTGQILSTKYYWVMDVAHWVNLVNKAYQDCWVALNTLFAGATGGLQLQTQPPRWTFDPSTNLFYCWCDRYGFGDNQEPIIAGPGNINVPSRLSGVPPLNAQDENFSMFMDANLFGMMGVNMENRYVNLGNSQTYKILVGNPAKLFNNIYNVTAPPAAVAKSYWYMVQDHPSTSSLWCPVESIVFTTGTLPLVFENTGEPVRFGTGNVGSQTSTQSAFIPIITDIQLSNETAFDYRVYTQYAPDAEYRMLSFQKSAVPITQIDLRVFYKNRLDGNLYPLTMYNLSSCSVKILFRRRGYFDYPHPVRKEPYSF
jgi:hypothetical protein